MFGLESLDLLIGLVTIYLTLGLACTVLVEAIAGMSKLRAKNLETALKEFLDGEISDSTDFVKAFYAHPLVQSLSVGTKGLPAYIPPATVSQVVHSLLTANNTGVSLKDAIAKLPKTDKDNRIKGLLNALQLQADNDIAAFRKAVETHFDSVMDRATGWVKKHQTVIALIVSFLLVFIGNVDTFALAKSLSSNPELTAKLITIAEQQLRQAAEKPAETQKSAAQPVTQNGPKSEPSGQGSVGTGNSPAVPSLEPVAGKLTEAEKALAEARLAVQAGGLQFGWKEGWPTDTVSAFTLKLLGLLISAFAVSLGAPFWFDVLQRFMKIRVAGLSPREKAAGTGGK
jgi:hypothetical protein